MIRILDYPAGAGSTASKRKARIVSTHPATPDFHQPVLLKKSVELLAPARGKLIVDGTLGGGGHSRAFLDAGATLIGLDQDPQALAFAMERLRDAGTRFRAVQANFCDLDDVLDRLHVVQINGGFLDLGVSSWQLDTPGRGFSFMREGPLDMRMNPQGPTSAADIVNNATGEQIERILRNFGEEPGARRIAARIARDRLIKPFKTTLDLARTVESVISRRGKAHPATRTFQALRIAVNRELESLSEGLEQFTRRLRSGGRLGVITFHSLEDRIVKTFFKQRSVEFIDRPEWPAPRRNPDYQFKLLTPKAIVAGEEEQSQNPRSRSAKLRVVEKI